MYLKAIPSGKGGLYVLLLLFSQIIVYSQGTLRGKVTDNNGELLIGAAISFMNNPGNGTTTDFDGNYSLDVIDDNSFIVIVSYLGYNDYVDTLKLENNEIKILDITMYPTSVSIQEVEIVAKRERGKAYFMESIKKKSATTLDYVPAELMKKIGDSNVTSAISRATGVSTNGSFISVRGIGDRYVKTTINGAVIPTLDPFTNNIKLDIIPSNLVDNLVITKTNIPELPGDWSAAYISIETKDYPEKFTLNVESQIGYNTQSSFKEIISNQTSGTDWLGFDNGFRDRNHSTFINVNDAPTRYQEMQALGLEDFYKSYGINESWAEGTRLGDEYFKIGLIGLGLLGKSYINDDNEFQKAKAKYFSGNYQSQAYRIINAEAAKEGQSIPNNWNISKKIAPINFSQSISVGNQHKIGKIEYSYLAGIRYGSSIDYDPNSNVTRTILSEVDEQGNALLNTNLRQKFARYTNGWSGLLNFNLKLNQNNSLSLLFMPNFAGNNSLRDGVDTTKNTLYNYAYTTSQFYEERSVYTYQLKSDHYLQNIGIKLFTLFSYSKGNSSAPDFKNLEYFSDDDQTSRFDKTLSDVRRNYRYLDEEVIDFKIGGEHQLHSNPGQINKISFGLTGLFNTKSFSQYDYFLRFNSGSTVIIENNDLNKFFAIEKFSIRPNASLGGKENIELFYTNNEIPTNFTTGESQILAGYLQYDRSLTSKLRMSGGLRAEYSDIFTDVQEFAEKQYLKNDLRRKIEGQSFTVNPAIKKSFDLLPSVNVIYRLNNDELFPTNIRGNYSRSLARPSLREFSETIVYDFELASDVFGNSELKYVTIDNYDLRIEKYLKNNSSMSVSLFYKNFKNHIELLSSNIGFSWTNADKSFVYGSEIELTKKLPYNFEARCNLSIIHSETTIKDQVLVIENGIKNYNVIDTITRSMFGQAPYVVNAILNYTNEKLGIISTLSYNYQGPKLVLYTTNDAPDVYEMPRHLIDYKISKDIFKQFSLSFSIKDLLNTNRRRAYKYDAGYILDFDNFKFGTTYQFSLSYKI